MARSNQDDFDGYRKWLGISNQKRLPTHYELLAISLDEDDPDVIQAAAEQRRHYVESKRGEGHDDLVTEIHYRIDEAESTLLNTALRRDYDRKMNLFEKRRKNRQVDPVARRSRRIRGGRAVGESGGVIKTFAGIMAIVCVAFGGMAWFGSRIQSKPAIAPAVPAPAQFAQQPVAVIKVQEQPIKQAEPDESKDNATSIAMKAIQGEWLCVAAEQAGKQIGPDDVKVEDRSVSISGNSFSMKRTRGDKRGGYDGKFEIDASNRHFEFVGNNGEFWLGIFELDGNILKLCYRVKYNNSPIARPKEFKTDSTDESNPFVLYTFQKVETQKLNDGSTTDDVTEADRRVAAWVLSKGGNVIVRTNGGESLKILPQGQLPTNDFNLVEVYLVERKEVGDQDIRRLVGLRQLTTLALMGTSVTDSALKDVGEITTLTVLNVAATSINGNGFQHLSKLEALNTLLCGGAPINDDSLVHLTKLPKLETIGLIDTQVSDIGMQSVATMQQLHDLRLAGSKVTDSGLNRLATLKSLKKLSLSRTSVSKKGVATIRAALPKCEVTE